MNIKDYKPDSIEGDRFDVNDDDLGHQPDLEDDPSHPEDILPDHLEALPEAEQFEEEDEKATVHPSQPVRPSTSAELPEG